jgi:hypothetical protein
MLLHSPCDSICLALPVCVFLQVASSTPWVWPATTTLTRCSASRQQRSSTVAWRWWPSWVSGTSWGVIQGLSRVMSASGCALAAAASVQEMLCTMLWAWVAVPSMHRAPSAACRRVPKHQQATQLFEFALSAHSRSWAGRASCWTQISLYGVHYHRLFLHAAAACPAGYGVQALSTGEGALGSLARFGESF